MQKKERPMNDKKERTVEININTVVIIFLILSLLSSILHKYYSRIRCFFTFFDMIIIKNDKKNIRHE